MNMNMILSMNTVFIMFMLSIVFITIMNIMFSMHIMFIMNMTMVFNMNIMFIMFMLNILFIVKDEPDDTNTRIVPRRRVPPCGHVFSNSDVLCLADVPTCSHSGRSNVIVDGGTIAVDTL